MRKIVRREARIEGYNLQKAVRRWIRARLKRAKKTQRPEICLSVPDPNEHLFLQAPDTIHDYIDDLVTAID
jgi:hypothetical protein